MQGEKEFKGTPKASLCNPSFVRNDDSRRQLGNNQKARDPSAPAETDQDSYAVVKPTRKYHWLPTAEV